MKFLKQLWILACFVQVYWELEFFYLTVNSTAVQYYMNSRDFLLKNLWKNKQVAFKELKIN